MELERLNEPGPASPMGTPDSGVDTRARPVLRAQQVARARTRAQGLSVGVMMACVAVIALTDFFIWRSNGTNGLENLLDEPAHVANGVLALGALGLALGPQVIVVMAGASVLIDFDHLPEVLGWHFLERGVQTPYTHSVATLIVVGAIALLLRGRARQLVLIALLALAVHFFRDAAEPCGCGESVLWPVSHRTILLGYWWYAAFVVVLAGLALARYRRR